MGAARGLRACRFGHLPNLGFRRRLLVQAWHAQDQTWPDQPLILKDMPIVKPDPLIYSKQLWPVPLVPE